MSRTRDTADLVTLNALNAEGGKVGIGTTAKSNQLTVEGDSLIVGVLTATTFVGDGSNLTGIAVTANVSTNTLNVAGVSTLGTLGVGGDLTITDTDTGSSAGPELTLFRDSSSPDDGDYLGQLMFKGRNDNGGEENYAKVTGKISDASLGTEDGLIETAIKGNGSFTIVSRQRSDELQLINGVGINIGGDLTLDNVGISSIIASSEAFVDNDTSLMTAAAIKDLIPTTFSATQGQLLQHNGSSVVGVSSEAYSDFVTDCTQGYYAYTTDAYTVGVANTIQELTEDVWNLLQPQVAATYNHQTHQMTAGNNGNPYVGSGATIGTGQTEFSLAGMSAGANCLVRIAFSYTPDIDDSDLDIRLFFTTNTATQGTGLTNFSIDKQALVITQGADEVYPGEILIPFFVGATLTGVSTANAGSFRIEAKPSDPGELEMKAVTVAVDN